MKKIFLAFMMLIFNLTITASVFTQIIEHPITKQKLKLYPSMYEKVSGFLSPFTTEDGKEIVLCFLMKSKYAYVEATVENGAILDPDRDLWGKGNQLEIDTTDFPTLARTGLHSEIELDRTKTITGWSIAKITEIGRPGKSSSAGFMCHNEDIISVLKGDNRLVQKMNLTHPQLAKALYHVWNFINIVGHREKNDEYIFYNGKKVFIKAHRTKPGQHSIFNDEFRGGSHIDIWREFDKKERKFLEEKYSRLEAEQMTVLKTKLSRMHTGEMEAYYIMRYGFYEGHTEYRTDPVAIAFIFGLKSIEELEAAFPGKLYETLINHFTM